MPQGVANVVGPASARVGFVRQLAEGMFDFIRVAVCQGAQDISLRMLRVSGPPIIPTAFAIVTRR